RLATRSGRVAGRAKLAEAAGAAGRRTSVQYAGDDSRVRAGAAGGPWRGRRGPAPPCRVVPGAGGRGRPLADPLAGRYLDGPAGERARQPAGGTCLERRGRRRGGAVAVGRAAVVLLVLARPLWRG